MRFGLVRVGVLGLATAVAACGSKGAPAAPTPTPQPTVTPKIEAPAPRSPLAGEQLDTLRPALTTSNATTTGSAGAVTYEFALSEIETFPEDSRTSSEKDVAQGADGATAWEPPSNLRPNTTYFWRVRASAANVSEPTDWSATQTFKSRARGFFIPGQELYDPLTDGATVGSRSGGHFVAGQGWQADTESDAIFYDVGACTSCTLQFDVTNVGKAAGASIGKDVKWLSMGDASTFGGFQIFRDHGWKMHLEQRSDGGGTGMKLIWRNGGDGDGNPGDHEKRNDATVDWRRDAVYRFTLQWSPNGFSVRVGVVGADGTVSGEREWFSDSFGGRPYAPPSLRVSLGCYPRSETMAGAIWRNVRLVRS